MSSEHANGLEGDSLANLNAGPAKKAACDRCRGQKLRCEWDADGPGQRCRRCTKAAAVCYIPPPRPLGRPRGNGTAKRGSDVRSQLIVLPASIPLSSSKALPANAPGDERLDEEDDERDSLDRLVDSFSAPPFSFELSHTHLGVKFSSSGALPKTFAHASSRIGTWKALNRVWSALLCRRYPIIRYP